MELSNPFKLEKLTIEAFEDAKRSTPAGKFEVAFNPATIARKYQNRYGKRATLNGGGLGNYTSIPDDLSLDLVFDGTGVKDYGLVKLFGGGEPTVTERVESFLDHCFRAQPSTHQPCYLRVLWGDMKLDCRLQSADITYTSFEKSGKPQRATIKATFLRDEDSAKEVRKKAFSSPDLTHVRVVKQGDTLPLMTAKIYGDPSLYMEVARANGLDHFRRLTPGTKLVFPPVAAGSDPGN